MFIILKIPKCWEFQIYHVDAFVFKIKFNNINDPCIKKVYLVKFFVSKMLESTCFYFKPYNPKFEHY